MTAPMTSVDPGPALEVRGLEVRYQGLVAVDSVDLRLDRGQIVALIGETGSGKSMKRAARLKQQVLLRFATL